MKRLAPDPSISTSDLMGPFETMFKQMGCWDLLSLVEPPKNGKVTWKSAADPFGQKHVSQLFHRLFKVARNGVLASSKVKLALVKLQHQKQSMNFSKLMDDDWQDKADDDGATRSQPVAAPMEKGPFVDEAGDVCELVVEEEAAQCLDEMAVLLQAPVTPKGSHPQHGDRPVPKTPPEFLCWNGMEGKDIGKERGHLALEDDEKVVASEEKEEGDEKVTKEAKGKKKEKEEKSTKEKRDKKKAKEEKLTKEKNDKRKIQAWQRWDPGDSIPNFVMELHSTFFRYPAGSIAWQRANTPLASGYHAKFIGVKGDLDFFAGTDQYQLAGVLVVLTHYVLPGNVEDNTKQLWAELKALCKELNIKDCYFQMKPSVFLRKKHGGKMRGKAAQIKALARPLTVLFERRMNPASEVHRKILSTLKANCKMERLMAESATDLAFTPNDAKAFHQACCQMAHLNLHVWRHFAQEDVPPIFQVTSKMHMLQHLTENSGALNPRMTWCYSQEDFTGAVRHMAQDCAAGTPPLMAGAKLMDHWLIAFELLQ
ncbi:Uncharacterized protein SCF082_LOCUS12578 [Durusdinium trenchii]|uniref:Uncharacterized protein n=1 Tax=Durusdinium trenchii TaxID=1381693 RepID=A0ABP0JKZ9_9DINO